jgi:hypothetical protein
LPVAAGKKGAGLIGAETDAGRIGPFVDDLEVAKLIKGGINWCAIIQFDIRFGKAGQVDFSCYGILFGLCGGHYGQPEEAGQQDWEFHGRGLADVK